MSDYGNRIKQLRESLGLSQEELASVAGISQRQISYYENGKNKPTAEIINRLSNALNTTSDYLLGMTDNLNREIHDESDLSGEELRIIEIIRHVKPEKRREILKVFEVLAGADV